MTMEQAPFSDSAGEIKNVLSESEIDGGETLVLALILFKILGGQCR